MNVRAAFRNWLLKPSAAELAGDSDAVALAGELVYGHIRRDISRMSSSSEGVIFDVLMDDECAAIERDLEQTP